MWNTCEAFLKGNIKERMHHPMVHFGAAGLLREQGFPGALAGERVAQFQAHRRSSPLSRPVAFCLQCWFYSPINSTIICSIRVIVYKIDAASEKRAGWNRSCLQFSRKARKAQLRAILARILVAERVYQAHHEAIMDGALPVAPG